SVYFSADDQFANAKLLGTFVHQGGLDSGARYSQQQSVTLPADLVAGTYRIFVQADAQNQVQEPGPKANNVFVSPTPLVVSRAPVPDLAMKQVTGPAQGVGVIGLPVAVSWTVQNNGAAAAHAPWTDRVYLSTDGTLTGAVSLGTFDHTTDLDAA